jgi:uncharacterized repeat protein (TIGR01451 family)
MRAIIGVISRVTVITGVAFLTATGVAAAQSAADLEVYLQKVPVTEEEATDFPITYSINIVNAGAGDAENVVVTDILPADVAFESTTSTACAFDSAERRFTCNLGLLPANSDVSVDLIVRTPATPATIVNTASVSSSTPDSDPADNSATMSLNVVQR